MIKISVFIYANIVFIKNLIKGVHKTVLLFFYLKKGLIYGINSVFTAFPIIIEDQAFNGNIHMYICIYVCIHVSLYVYTYIHTLSTCCPAQAGSQQCGSKPFSSFLSIYTHTRTHTYNLLAICASWLTTCLGSVEVNTPQTFSLISLHAHTHIHTHTHTHMLYLLSCASWLTTCLGSVEVKTPQTFSLIFGPNRLVLSPFMAPFLRITMSSRSRWCMYVYTYVCTYMYVRMYV
jgi:hypothetical protein